MTARPSAGAPRIHGVEIYDLEIPMIRPHRSAGTDIGRRRVLIVRIGAAAVEGWGECSPVPGYSPETASDAWQHLREAAGNLVGQTVADPPALGEILGSGPPSTRHAVETAGWDARSRWQGRSLRELLGGEAGAVPVGVVLSRDATREDLHHFAEAGYARIKLKVEGNADLPRIAELQAAGENLPPLAIDANGSFSPRDVDALAASLDDLDLAFVEQPFPQDELEATIRLQRLMQIPVCLDEPIVDVRAAEQAISSGAARLVVVKPARLGGIAASLAASATARHAGGSAWVGGMLETGIGRAAALALAASGSFAIAADLSPPATYLERDIVCEAFPLEGSGVRLPEGPGLGVTVDLEAIEQVATAHCRFGSF